MACSDEDRGRSSRPGVEDRGWSHRSGTQLSDGREVGWRCVRSAGFLVEPQNQGRRFVSCLASKPLRRFLIGLGLKTDGGCL
jgi:hypothetical protein